MQKKKILVISQNYYPEQFRINDICEELVKIGHDVTVLTGLPNYPQGKLYPGYEKKQKRHEVINGIKVIRAYERERKSGGAINLFLNYYSFMFSSQKTLNKLDHNFDVVLVNQLSPIMQAKAGIKYKKKYGAKLILYCLDLWPASLLVGGIKQNGLIYNYYKMLSKKIYNACDKLLVTSKMFIDYFQEEFGFDTSQITYLPQYAEDMFKDLPTKKSDGKTNLVFAGNVGKAQSVETIIKAARLLESNTNLSFHIIGNGSNLENCKKLAEGLSNVKFYGQLPLEEMPNFYAMADAMLVSLGKNDLISKTLPGKVQTYMAAGKPIIASGDNEMKNIIEEAGCGLCSTAEDEKLLSENILKFIESSNKQEMGQKARKYYENNFSKELFFKKLEQILEN